MKNKFEDAKLALEWFRGPNSDVLQELQVKWPEVNFFSLFHRSIFYLQEIEDSLKVVDKEKTTLFQMKYLRPMIVSLGLMLFQQLSGINAVVFYSVIIFLKNLDRILQFYLHFMFQSKIAPTPKFWTFRSQSLSSQDHRFRQTLLRWF